MCLCLPVFVCVRAAVDLCSWQNLRVLRDPAESSQSGGVALCGYGLTQSSGNSKHTYKHMLTLFISCATHTQLHVTPGKTFLDSWPERLEGWPRFQPVTFSHLFSDALYDTCGYSSFLTLVELDLICLTLIWQRFGKWIHSFRYFLRFCDCLLFCLIWVAVKIEVEKSLTRLTQRRKKRTQGCTVTVWAAFFPVKDD